jgi:hypothetical protein
MNIKTDKDAFNFVAKQLIAQDAKCLNSAEDCVYRGYSQSFLDELRDKAREAVYGYDEKLEDEDCFADCQDYFLDLLSEADPDLKCAAGHLILDQFYDQNIEGQTVMEDAPVEEAIKLSNPDWNYQDSSLELVKTLQQVHDFREVSSWPVLFQKLEKYFDEDGKYLPNSVLKSEVRSDGYRND